MRAIKFKQATVNVAEKQDFITLPAWYGQLGENPQETGLVTCFEFSPEDLVIINKHRKIWHTQITGGYPMQPIQFFVANDFFDMNSEEYPAHLNLDIVQLEEDRFKWSLETFPDGNTVSALEHLIDEVKEIQADPTDVKEYADALMLLFEAAARSGITVGDILDAFHKKHQVNLTRKWERQPNGSYKHIEED